MPGLAHLDDDYETPQWVMDKIREITGKDIGFDMCASDSNTKSNLYFTKEQDVLSQPKSFFNDTDGMLFCNPPTSKNAKFVDYVYDLWNQGEKDIVMLLRWNDVGNNYGEKIFNSILNHDIFTYNLGKVKFYKNGEESQYPSRLTYFIAWFKKTVSTEDQLRGYMSYEQECNSIFTTSTPSNTPTYASEFILNNGSNVSGTTTDGEPNLREYRLD